MILEKLMEGTGAVCRQGDAELGITAITDDSRRVQKGSLFICIQGMETDGHAYICEAVEKGAAALLVASDYFEKYSQQLSAYETAVWTVKDTRRAAAEVAAAFYGYPSNELKVIGITGTKGKTTTAYMIRDILKKAGYKTGLLGTIEYDTGESVWPSVMTTPEAIDTQRYLREMADNGCKFAVMEVTSQGLKLHRADCIRFDVGIFTNFGSDHISAVEHADIEEYAACKATLFKHCRLAVGNLDDSWYSKIVGSADCEKMSFGYMPECDFAAENVTLFSRNGHLETLFSVRGEEYDVSIPGLFSVYNALSAIAVGTHYGISSDIMKKALEEVCVPGRVEPVAIDKPYMVLIDYAHNGLSLKNILTTMRRYHPYRLMVLFGCGGGRAANRRYEMGQVAGRYADFTVVTSDNPRDEEPEAIMEEIRRGIAPTGGEYVMIPDRRQAIRYLLEMAKPGDILILAGKGHERWQERKGEKIPFDERQIVRELLDEIDNGN